MADSCFVDRVPFDILHDIFCLCFTPGKYDAITAPILLSQVSRRWRSFALDCPILWSTILFRDGLGRGDGERWDMQIAFLRRSGDCPLCILIHGAWDGPKEMKPRRELFSRGLIPTVKGILRVIVPHSARWQEVQLPRRSCPYKVIRVFLDRLQDLQFPRLRNFSATMKPYDCRWKGLALHHWGQLEHLEISGIPADYSSVTFENLRTLTVADPSYRHIQGGLVKVVRYLLAHSPLLERFKVTAGWSWTIWSDDLPQRWRGMPPKDIPPFVVHRHLKSIQMNARMVNVAELFQTVQFTTVERFTFAIMGSDQENVLFTDQIIAIAPYTVFPGLKRLQLIKGSSLAVWKALKGFPMLEELTLVKFGLETGLQPFEELCPSLLHLTVKGKVNVAEFSENNVRDMVARRMRREGFTPLRSLNVSSVAVARDEEAFDWLQSLPGFKYIRSVPNED